jgi:hypothetical protein
VEKPRLSLLTSSTPALAFSTTINSRDGVPATAVDKESHNPRSRDCSPQPAGTNVRQPSTESSTVLQTHDQLSDGVVHRPPLFHEAGDLVDGVDDGGVVTTAKLPADGGVAVVS